MSRQLSAALDARLTALDQQVDRLTRDVEQTERRLLLLMYRMERLDRLERRLRSEEARAADGPEASALGHDPGRRGQDRERATGTDTPGDDRAMPKAPERPVLSAGPRPGPAASAFGPGRTEAGADPGA